MSRYVLGVDTVNKRISGIWRCPSFLAAGFDASVSSLWTNYGYFHSNYALYYRRGGTDGWPNDGYASKPTELCGRDFDANRLLMSDRIFRWWVNAGWTYNHGLRSFASGVPGVPAIAGVNRLYADGRVEWFFRFNAGLIEPPGNLAVGYVGTGDTTGPDFHYY